VSRGHGRAEVAHAGRERPLVSAIVTTYNRSALLREALDSVMGVVGKGDAFDLETIVVDDASTDGTKAVVARYPARYIRNPVNRGLSASRNIGIAASRGKYVAFLDDDDVWLPHRFRAQVAALEAHPELGVAYSPCLSTVDGVPLPDGPAGAFEGPSGDVFRALLLRGNFLSGSVLGVLVRRSAFERAGEFRALGIEDYEMWLRLARHVPFVCIPGPVAIRRWSRDGMFLTLIVTGRSRTLYREIINDALALVPDASPAFQRRVVDVMELGNLRDLLAIARPLRDLPDPECVSQVLAHLAEYRRLARLPQARRAISWFARTVVLRAASPFDAATALCAGIVRSCGPSRETRRLVARAWVEIAIGLCLAGRGSASLHAAALAFRNDPTQLLARLVLACGDKVRLLRRDARGPFLEEQYAMARRRSQGEGTDGVARAHAAAPARGGADPGARPAGDATPAASAGARRADR